MAVCLTNNSLSESKCTILRSGRIEFSIRTKSDTVDGPKVTLEILYFHSSFVVKLIKLQIFPSTDENLVVFVQRCRVNGAGNRHLLFLFQGVSIKKGDTSAVGHSENVAISGQLHAADLFVKIDPANLSPCCCVPQSESLVVRATEQLAVVGSVGDLLNSRCVPFKLDDGFCWLLQVEYPQNLVIAGCSQSGAVAAKVDTFDDMFMLQGTHLELSRSPTLPTTAS